MKYLLPLVFLLGAPAVGAAQNETSQQTLWMQKGLTAHVVGSDQTRIVRGNEVLVFDSYTDAESYTTTSGTPRTYMGMPIDLASVAGNNPSITKITAYLAYTGTAAQTYNSLRVRIQLWDTWTETGTPVFSTAAGATIEADIAGPVTLNPNSFTPVDVPLPSPIPLTGLTGHGFTVNYQGDTGSGLAANNNLTSLLRYGANPVAVGTNAMADTYGYRNASNRTDFNFLSSDARSFGEVNEATVIQLYSTTSLTSQNITNFVANPAAPIVADGTFTVSATGGASGNPVVFTIAAGSATVCTAGGTNGATVTILTAGTCTVLANQAGDASYSAAPQQTLAVTIGTGVPPQLVEDGSFEAGLVSTYWAQTSTNYGTPLCDASCGGVGPRTGDYWAWFGGASTAETGSVQQVGAISTGPKTLNFYIWWSSSVDTPPDPAATFTVKIDGNTIFSLTPATAATYNTDYTLASVDISAYADGNNHTLRFESNSAAAASATNIHVDDIEIVAGPADEIFVDGFEL